MIWNVNICYYSLLASGFGDSDNDDNQLIDEMVTVLKNYVKSANILLILFNGEMQRFDENIQALLFHVMENKICDGYVE